MTFMNTNAMQQVMLGIISFLLIRVARRPIVQAKTGPWADPTKVFVFQLAER